MRKINIYYFSGKQNRYTGYSALMCSGEFKKRIAYTIDENTHDELSLNKTVEIKT